MPKCDISTTAWPIPQNLAQWYKMVLSRTLTVTKKDIDDTFEKPILHHHEISQFYIRCIEFKLKIFSRCKKIFKDVKNFFNSHSYIGHLHNKRVYKTDITKTTKCKTENRTQAESRNFRFLLELSTIAPREFHQSAWKDKECKSDHGQKTTNQKQHIS